MRKIIFATAIATIGFVSMSFINNEVYLTKASNDNLVTTTEVNEDVKSIIENKCYGCHNSESKNTKGKKKLSFDKLDELSIYKQIGKYEGVHEVVSESKMPPKKFLAKYPNKALTDKEKETLLTWATSKAKELAK